MCGISVIVALQGQSHELRRQQDGTTTHPQDVAGADITTDDSAQRLAKELDLSLDKIQHRGPDSRGQYISPDKRVGPLFGFPSDFGHELY